MSIDRELIFLNKHWNLLNERKWNDKKPSKMVNFVKDSTLKYLIPSLMLTIWWFEWTLNDKEESIHDESASPFIVDGINTNFIIESNKHTLDISKDKSYEVPIVVMNDDIYDENYISSISLDEDLDYAPWTHSFQTDKESLYMTMYKRLCNEDYQNLFKWLKNLKQWSLGNCYFVVAIKNLARSKYFDTLMMTSLEKNSDNSFNLYMPLWEPQWVKIHITHDDLKATTIWWPLWYKILEIWFAKYLLFKKWVISNPNITMTNAIMKKMRAWSAWQTMMSLLWPKSFINKCINISNKSQIMNSLINYDPKNLSVISASSKFKKWKNDENSYEVWWETIYYGHAYCICGVEKEWDSIKNVILDNPRNNVNKKWWQKIKLSIDDFFDAFLFVNIGHITHNFLNIVTIDEEMKVIDSRDRRKS